MHKIRYWYCIKAIEFSLYIQWCDLSFLSHSKRECVPHRIAIVCGRIAGSGSDYLGVLTFLRVLDVSSVYVPKK